MSLAVSEEIVTKYHPALPGYNQTFSFKSYFFNTKKVYQKFDSRSGYVVMETHLLEEKEFVPVEVIKNDFV